MTIIHLLGRSRGSVFWGGFFSHHLCSFWGFQLKVHWLAYRFEGCLPHSKHTQCRSVVACSLLVSDSQETWGLSPSKCPRRQRHFSETTENPNIFGENNRCWFIWEFKDQPPSSILTKTHGSDRNHCNLLHANSQTLLCTEFTTAKGCTFSWFLTHCLVCDLRKTWSRISNICLSGAISDYQKICEECSDGLVHISPPAHFGDESGLN